jgi:hypothetical protein
VPHDKYLLDACADRLWLLEIARASRHRQWQAFERRPPCMSAVEEKMGKLHDFLSRIDKSLAESALFIEERGELERILIAAEEEGLRLAGECDSARKITPADRR